MQTETSRRRLLAVAMVLPMATIAAPALAVPGDDHAEWDRLCRQYRAASDAYRNAGDEFEKRHGQATRAVNAIVEPTKPASLPLDMNRTLADVAADANSPETRASWKLYDQAKTEYEIQTAAIREGIIGDTEERWEAAMTVHEEAISALRLHPATSVAMLREKADILRDEFPGMLDDDDAAALIADIRRLADLEG